MDKLFNSTEIETLKLREPVPLTTHPAAVYLDSLGEGSKLTMTHSLNAIASLLTSGECDLFTLDWTKLRYRHTSAVRSVLIKRFAPHTVNKMLAALRRVLQEAFKLDLMNQQDYLHASDLARVKTQRKLRGRALTTEEIDKLLSSCNSPYPLDVRDGAIIAILRGGGLRRAELVNLNLADLNLKIGSLEILNSKGNKDRMVYLPQSAIPFIKKWLKVRGKQPGALLCPVNRGGNILIRNMCPDAILKIIRKRALKAGIETFSPHDFRRTFCGDLLEAGVDIVTVQKLAGHANPITTAKYDRRGEDVKRRAVQNLEF